MINFRQDLENGIINLCKDWVGVGTDPTNYVKTFDNHLHAFDLDDVPEPFPFIVVNVRQAEISGRSDAEIAQPAYNLYSWTVHIYYIDTTEEYNEGEAKRDQIVGKVIKNLEENPRLGNLESTNPDGKREYVWDSNITAALFDSSGEEQYYTFITEVYLTVDTAKR